jgi:integrase
MAAKLERTSTPGVFRRHSKTCERRGRCDCPYVIVWRNRGRQATDTFRTMAEAREAKRTRESESASGQFSPLTRVTLREYALDWVERYQGNGRRGFREETRDEYRRLLNIYALKFFPPGTRLTEVGPKEIADFVGWLVKQPARRRGNTRPRPRTLSDKSVRNALGPLSACLATARREGLIRHNSASDAVLPHRPQIEDDEEQARPFPRIEDGDETVETMELVVQLVHSDHRLLFELLAATGLRRSELLVLEGRHLMLRGERPYVKVRQRVRRRRGAGLVIGPLKSKHARRDLPIPLDLADRLQDAVRGPRELFFSNERGGILDPDNLAARVLRPACSEAGVEWAGFHTFRHTVASRLFAEGRNVVQVQRWLGHHSPSFTLDTYVHLLEGDLGAPLEPVRVNSGSTGCPESAANGASPEMAETV